MQRIVFMSLTIIVFLVALACAVLSLIYGETLQHKALGVIAGVLLAGFNFVFIYYDIKKLKGNSS
jgi:hypothetical protein